MSQKRFSFVLLQYRLPFKLNSYSDIEIHYTKLTETGFITIGIIIKINYVDKARSLHLSNEIFKFHIVYHIFEDTFKKAALKSKGTKVYFQEFKRKNKFSTEK